MRRLRSYCFIATFLVLPYALRAQVPGDPNFNLAGDGGGRGGQGTNLGGGGAPSPALQAAVNASYDDRTNTLVVSGSAELLKQIADLVAKIDANPAKGEEIYTYKLRNGSALNIEAVANLLFNGTGGANRGANSQLQLGASRNSLTSGSTSGGGGGGRGGGGGGGGLGTGSTFGTGATVTAGTAGIGGSASTNAISAMAGKVTVVADPNTNSLLVTTTPDLWTQVKPILDSLDRSVPQVLIQVMIVEVTHDDSSDIGSEFSVLNLRPSGNGQQGGTNFNIPLTGASATGAIVQILETNFTSAIRALETKGKLDVLSRPYILAADNQQATITVGQRVPYVSNSQTTAEGNTINTVLYSDVGILLDVIPHINPDGMVILDVAPEISALTDSTVQVSETVSAPIFTNRSAQSRIAVQNNQTVVIGGLMEDRKQKTVNKVPVLGDIPVVGNLFKRTQDSKSKTELLIFLTPHVAARPDMLEGMGKDQLDRTKLVPGAVEPGVFQSHLDGMKAGQRDIPATLPGYRRDGK